MSQEPTETAACTVRPSGGAVNEAVRASLLAVKASHRAARRRVLRDRVVTAVAAALTVTAIWGISRQLGGEAAAKPASTAVTQPADHKLVPSASGVEADKPASPAQPQVDQPAPQLAEAPKAQALVAEADPADAEALAPSLTEPLVARATPVASGAFDPAVAAACDKAVKRKHWLKISTLCATAYEQAPSAPLALSVAQAYHRRGRIPEAGQWAERVLAIEPSHPEAFIIVAHAAELAEQKAKAKAAYRQYLALAPRGWHASEARQALGAVE